MLNGKGNDKRHTAEGGMGSHAIAITGEGIVCAIGLDKQSVLASLKEGRSGIGPIRQLGSKHRDLPVGEVPLSDSQMRTCLGLGEEPFMNRTTLLGMMAVRQALEDARVTAETVRGKGLRVVLVSGTTVAGMDVTERYFSLLGQSDVALRCLEYHSAGSSTRRMAEYFGLFAEYTTISTACSSAANALLLGARMLADGEADMVVAGGTEALSLFHLNGFLSLMILDHEPCRPFDARRQGLNLGEGAAFVVMETAAAAAQRRGVAADAFLTGYGNACDAYHQTASSPDGEGAFLAMTEALRMAGLGAEDIGYVNAHGTGTPNNDLSESVALKRVFGEHMPLVSSTKGFTGHTTSASGAIEAVICVLALTHQMVPANLGWKTPMANGIVPTLGMEHSGLQHVLCNAFGFGGNDTSLVFSRSTLHLPPSTLHLPPSTKVTILSEVEINSEEQLAEIRDYVSPMEARRMGKLMKSSLLAALKALKAAGIERPDAIITATGMGSLEYTERLLRQLADEGEGALKPTFFMQSTHNTISSNTAIWLGCHGYNVTYSQDADSMDWALRDARRLLGSGKYKTVLVGQHDETTPFYRQLMKRLGVDNLPSVSSKVLVLSCGE